jgi:hypothetical protein
VADHQAFYGQEPEMRTEKGRRVATFAVKPSLLRLVEADRNGLQEVVLTAGARRGGYLDTTLAHGARIRVG